MEHVSSPAKIIRAYRREQLLFSLAKQATNLEDFGALFSNYSPGASGPSVSRIPLGYYVIVCTIMPGLEQNLDAKCEQLRQ